MLLRFIGKDGSMGLMKGQVYNTKVFSRGNAIFVSWVIPGKNKTRACAYNSPSALAKNWEAI